MQMVSLGVHLHEISNFTIPNFSYKSYNSGICMKVKPYFLEKIRDISKKKFLNILYIKITDMLSFQNKN